MADQNSARIPCFCALCVSRCGAIATVTHGRFAALDADPEHPTGQALCDADLAILASTPGRYAEYAADVRREYAHVSDEDFAHGRAAVLTDLLAKPALFQTERGHELWEAAARANVTAELRQLTGQSGA